MLKRMDEFLADEAISNQGTANTYASGLRSYDEYCARSDVMGKNPYDGDTVADWFTWLNGDYSPNTLRVYASAISMYFEYIRGIDGIEVNLARFDRLRRKAPSANDPERVREMTDIRNRDIPKLMEWFDRPLPEADSYGRRLSALRDRAVFWTLYDTACRIGEVVRLDGRDWQGIKESGKAYVIGKGGKKCCLRFGKRSVAAITDYLYARITFPVDKPMFISHSRNTNGKRISTVTAHNAIKDAVEELGLDESISAHDIRHYRATQLINSGVPLHIIQTLLNHGSIEITRKYYAVVDSDESVDNYLSKVNHYGEVTHEA